MHDDSVEPLTAADIIAALHGGRFRQSEKSLRRLLAGVVEAFGADAAVLAVAEPDSGLGPHLRLLGSTGYQPHELAGWERFPRSLSTPVTEAMRSGLPVRVTPPEMDRRFPVIAQVAAARVLVALPVKVDGEAVGALGLRMPPDHPEPSAAVLDLASLAVSRAVEDRAQLLMATSARR